MRGLVSRLRRDERGVSAMEFALILPILVALSAGTIEYSRLILLTQKLQSAAYILSDLTARYKDLPPEQMSDLFLAVDQVIQPFDFAPSGRAIVTSVGADSDDDRIVLWQCGGSGSFAAASEIGATLGGAAAIPGDLALKEGETIIAAEIFFEFEPLFGIGLAPPDHPAHRLFQAPSRRADDHPLPHLTRARP